MLGCVRKRRRGKGWVTQQRASERARDGRRRSSEGGISGRRKKGGAGGDHEDGVDGNVEGDGIVWLGGSWDPVLTVRTGQGGRRRGGEARRGSSGEEEEEERSAKIERRSSRRLNEEQRRRRIVVRKGFVEGIITLTCKYMVNHLDVGRNLACLGAWGVLGFASFGDLVVGVGVRFLSVSLFRSFRLCLIFRISLVIQLGNTIHPSTTFKKVPEGSRASQRIVLCVVLLNLHHHGLLSFKAAQEAARL